MHPPQQVDPDGDMVLSIGLDEDEDRRLIQVSSKILILTSPVFAALLSPKFAEGRALASSTDPQHISLPEDNPEAMTWLCQALHFKKRVTKEISFPLLMELAILCDKYDLSLALGPWSELWMQTWDGSVEGVDRYPQMLWISYALDKHNQFWNMSRELIRLYTSEGLLLASGEVTNGILPDRILDSISTERESVLLRLQTTIEEMVISHLQRECPQKVNHERNHQACDRLSTAGHFLSELVRLGLWPISRILHQTNLATISNQLLHFENYYKDDSNYEGRRNGNDYYNNYSSTSACTGDEKNDFKSMLKQAVDEASQLQQGLCLKCVKHGKVTNEEGNCHALFSHRCKG